MRPFAVPVLLALSFAVAVATAVAILKLPSVGATRSPVADINAFLREQGLPQHESSLQVVRERAVWSDDAIATRRNNYLAAGGLVVVTLLGSTAVATLRDRRRRED